MMEAGCIMRRKQTDEQQRRYRKPTSLAFVETTTDAACVLLCTIGITMATLRQESFYFSTTQA